MDKKLDKKALHQWIKDERERIDLEYKEATSHQGQFVTDEYLDGLRHQRKGEWKILRRLEDMLAAKEVEARAELLAFEAGVEEADPEAQDHEVITRSDDEETPPARYHVEHEFDFEPTFVVGPGGETIAEFQPGTDEEGGLPWKLRLEAARQLADWLNARPTDV